MRQEQEVLPAPLTPDVQQLRNSLGPLAEFRYAEIASAGIARAAAARWPRLAEQLRAAAKERHGPA
ncbi:MAG TPA: hypothetical protein VHE37_06545 [Nevskiaceae bacterium]|nr:hypothetical protein [Nevskiaceae bacterium]